MCVGIAYHATITRHALESVGVGQGLESHGNLKGAVEKYQEAIKINPRFPYGLAVLGNAYHRLGEDEKAIDCYEKALAISPHHFGVHYLIGELYRDDGRYREAIDKFNELIVMKDNWYQSNKIWGYTRYQKLAYGDLSFCYDKIDDRPHAIESQRRYVALNPDLDPKLIALEHRLMQGLSSVPELLEGLKNSHAMVRAAAVQGLRVRSLEPAAKASAPRLIALLKRDPDDMVRLLAAEVLGSLQSQEAIPALILASGDANEGVRAAALGALGMLGPSAEKATPQFLIAIKESNPSIRAAAAIGLGRIGATGKAVVPGLIEALKDPEWNVRQNAAISLGNLGLAAKESVPALAKSLSDPHGYVRSWAAYALYQIGPDQQAIPALLQAVQNKDRFVRLNAAKALSKIPSGMHQAVQSLSHTLEHDNNAEIRQGAIQALQEIATPEARAVLTQYRK